MLILEDKAGIGPLRPRGTQGFVCRPFGPLRAVDPNGYQWIPQGCPEATEITVFAGVIRRKLMHTHDTL
jgi:hypothetical protein